MKPVHPAMRRAIGNAYARLCDVVAVYAGTENDECTVEVYIVVKSMTARFTRDSFDVETSLEAKFPDTFFFFRSGTENRIKIPKTILADAYTKVI